jgi:hypothetical protein
LLARDRPRKLITPEDNLSPTDAIGYVKSTVKTVTKSPERGTIQHQQLSHRVKSAAQCCFEGSAPHPAVVASQRSMMLSIKIRPSLRGRRHKRPRRGHRALL